MKKQTKIIALDLDKELPNKIYGVEEYATALILLFKSKIPVGQVRIYNHYTPIYREQIYIEILNQFKNVLKNRFDESKIKNFDYLFDYFSNKGSYFTNILNLSSANHKESHFNKHYTLSVIICTNDKPEDLRTCLDNVLELKNNIFEIIVVGNNQDSVKTRSVVNSMNGVKYIAETRKGISYMRNTGVKASTGDVIAFINDDVIITPNWIKYIVLPFYNEKVMCVTGLVFPYKLDAMGQEMFEIYSSYWRGHNPKLFNDTFFSNSKPQQATAWNIDAATNIAFRREVLFESGLFNKTENPDRTSGVGDNNYILYRILRQGHLCYYMPAAYVWHKYPTNWKDLKKQIFITCKTRVSGQLQTIKSDKDFMAIWQMLNFLAKGHLWRTYAIIKGRFLKNRYIYSFKLLFVEVTGYFAGLFAFLRSIIYH